MNRRTNEYLRDILDSAEIIEHMVDALTFEEFLTHKYATDAVHYRIVVIGEACRRIRDEEESLIEQHPVLAKWTSMRNILAHDYGNVLEDIVWEAATVDRVALINLVKSLLGDDGLSIPN